MTSQPGPSVVEEFVESQAGESLLLRSWQPGRTRAVVAAVHGSGSDGARYEGFALALAMSGMATFAIDLGRRDGTLASHTPSQPLEGYLPDIGPMMSRIRQKHPTTPLFMLGHGAGALVACSHALRSPHELDGIICEGIALDPSWKAMIPRKWRWLAHALRLPETTFFHAGRRFRLAVGRLSLPLLLLHGSEDTMAPPRGSEYLHRHAGSTDKTLQVFEGYDHDLINGRGHALVRGKIGQWIEGQLDSSACRRHIGIEYINERP